MPALSADLPAFIEPCLPTNGRVGGRAGALWAHEIKHDGYQVRPLGAWATGCGRSADAGMTTGRSGRR